MITYPGGFFGFSILLRIHGSAVYKALLPAICSSSIYLVLSHTVDIHKEGERDLFVHPYPMGALIAALTFLLAFRANFSYNRYWESVTAVHQMHSKWLDVGMELAAFHLQSAIYDGRKPPAFGAYPEINSLERARERKEQLTLEQLEIQLDEMEPESADVETQSNSLRSTFFRRRKGKLNASGAIDSSSQRVSSMRHVSSHPSLGGEDDSLRLQAKSINAVDILPDSFKPEAPANFSPFGQLMTRWLRPQTNPMPTTVSNEKPTADSHVVQSTAGNKVQAWEKDRPPLFLQEAAHLLSLLSAVAFSTLRNDLDHAASPIIPFTPGAPWPHVDPDAYTADVRRDWAASSHRSVTVMRYILGLTRSDKDRTLYNAARPFRVIGGVSDAEIELLQAARGPMAKVALSSMWLHEFISREYLSGSTGKVAPPILSRLYQFTSDGMLGYHQARKIAYTPFPFPHAQITSLFVLIVCGLMPVLMLAFLENDVFGFFLNLLTVMCFAGLHEVARELENPFKNVPNDVPLNNFQAQFNESLMQMFTGYHRDAYWEVVVDRKKSEKLKAKELKAKEKEEKEKEVKEKEAQEKEAKEKEAKENEKSDLKSNSKVKVDQTKKIGKMDLEKAETSATKIPTPEVSLDTPKKNNVTSSQKSSPLPQDITNPSVEMVEEDKTLAEEIA